MFERLKPSVLESYVGAGAVKMFAKCTRLWANRQARAVN